jgi:hypothetical protein
VSDQPDDDKSEWAYAAVVAKLNNTDILLDTACTVHCFVAKSLFETLTLYKDDNKQVYFGDDKSSVIVKGHGIVKLMVPGYNGHPRKVTFSNVYYTPHMRTNLLSTAQMEDSGIRFTINDGIMRAIDKKSEKVILAGYRFFGEGLYKVKLHKDFIHVVHAPEDINIWHYRLGHLNFDSIKQLVHEDMVKDITITGNPTQCSICLKGKQTCTIPKGPSSHATELFQLVHSDLSGKFSVPSLGKSYYYITFIDDYSRYICYIPTCNQYILYLVIVFYI